MPTLNEIEQSLAMAEGHAHVVSVRDQAVELWLIIRAIHRFEKAFPGIEPIAELRERTYGLFETALRQYNIRIEPDRDMVKVYYYNVTSAVMPDRYNAYRYALDIILDEEESNG